MSKRISGYVVVLADDVGDDTDRAAATLTALQQIKGVVSVEPVPAAGAAETLIIEQRVDRVWRRRVLDLVKDSIGRVDA